MTVPLLLVEGDSALRSRTASWVLLRFPPPLGPTAVHAPWLDILCFCFDALGNVVTELFLAGREGMAFLGLPCLLWMLYLPGKLLQLFYQTLVDETKSFHFVFISLHCFHYPRGSAAHIAWWILHPWWISVTPACVPC